MAETFVAVVGWEDNDRLYTAVSSDPMSRLDDFALLCVQWMNPNGCRGRES